MTTNAGKAVASGGDVPVQARKASSGVGRRGRRKTLDKALWWFGLLLVPLIWQVYATFMTDSPLIVGPVEVVQAAVGMVQDGRLITAAAESGIVFLAGTAAGTVVGLFIGVLMGRSKRAEIMLDPYVSAIYATPLVAIIPILIVVLGFGVPAKIVIVGIFVFFPVALNTATGVRAVPKDLTELARSFCSTEPQAWRDILVPGALPYIVAGMRLAVGRALIAVVVAEFSTAVTGLGFLILSLSRRFQVAESLAPVLLLMITGFLLYQLLKAVEAKLAPWIVRSAD